MNIDVIIVYAKDKSSTKINSVPLSCPISKIKDIIMKVNKMSSSNTIRVVYRGKILQDELLLSNIVTNEQKEITLYASGVTILNSKSQIQNTKDNSKEKKTGNSKKKLNLVILFFLLSFVYFISFMIIKLVYFDPTKYGFQDVKLQCSQKSVFYGIIFFDVLISIFFIFLSIRVNFISFFRYAYLFLISFLPFFDINEYRREHRLDPL